MIGGRAIRLWQDELGASPPEPLLDPDACFVAYNSTAEFAVFLALGWPLPANVVDFFAERRARGVVDREGLTVPTADGGRKGHPAVNVMETARAQAARLLGDFGWRRAAGCRSTRRRRPSRPATPRSATSAPGCSAAAARTASPCRRRDRGVLSWPRTVGPRGTASPGLIAPGSAAALLHRLVVARDRMAGRGTLGCLAALRRGPGSFPAGKECRGRPGR